MAVVISFSRSSVERLVFLVGQMVIFCIYYRYVGDPQKAAKEQGRVSVIGARCEAERLRIAAWQRNCRRIEGIKSLVDM